LRLDFLSFGGMILVWLLLFLSGCQTTRPATTADPSQGWQVAPSVEPYADSEQLAILDQAITDNYPTINSMVIVRDGYIIFEGYYNGTHAETQQAIFSITKSVLSMLVGIAIDQGLLEGVDQPVGDFLVDSAAGENSEPTTLEALLTMTAGLDDATTFPAIRGCLATSSEWRPCIAEVVQTHAASNNVQTYAAPAQFLYSESAAHLLSIILSDVSGGSALDFAEETLFQPLSIEPQFWEADPQGHNWGGYGLRMTTRDLAKLGYLYLNAGQWGDAQLVSADWIAQSTRKQRDGGPPLGVGYGYLWWVPTVGEHDAYAAFGRGGQLLLVIPELDTVVVITAAPDVVAPNLLQLLERVVVPPLESRS